MTQSNSTDYHYKNMLHAIKIIFKNEGILGFYKGLVPSLFGVTHVIVQFPVYEYLKKSLQEKESLCSIKKNDSNDHELSVKSILIASSTSKIIASFFTYPHEIIRTRLQTQNSNQKYNGIKHLISMIIKNEGLFTFYNGFGTNLFRIVPASIVTLFSYETIVHFVDKM